MRLQFLAVLLLSLCVACSSEDEKGSSKNGIKSGDLQKVSKNVCPEGQKLTLIEYDFGIFQTPFPSPVVFGIEKGGASCVLTKELSEGSAWSWLNVTFSNSCLENGSLWLISSFTNMDGNKVYLRLKPVDNSGKYIQIFTSYAYSMNAIRSKIGLQTYSCSP